MHNFPISVGFISGAKYCPRRWDSNRIDRGIPAVQTRLFVPLLSIGLAMQSSHSWHAKSIAVLAVVFFGSATSAYLAEPTSDAGTKAAAKVPVAAAPAAGAVAEPPVVPTPAPPLAVGEDAPLPGAMPPAREAAGPNPDSPRRPFGKPPTEGGPQFPSAQDGPQPFNGGEPPRRPRSGMTAESPQGPPANSNPSFSPSPLGSPKKKAEKIRFQFRFQPWKEVLDWFAQQADLSLVIRKHCPRALSTKTILASTRRPKRSIC